MTDVQMDYDMMEEMGRLFKEASQHMEDLTRAMQDIATRLEDGALQGQAGQLFAEALRNNLSTRIGTLRDKLDELSMDIYAAMTDMYDADQRGAAGFGD